MPAEIRSVLHTVFLFDSFQLDVTRRKLLSAGGLVLPLNSRAMDALLLLVENAGQVVDRRRLMQTVWPGTVVEDNNLNQCVLAIRKALGETAGANQYVMTIQGRGFCFVCPVRRVEKESPDHDPVATSRNGLLRLLARRQFWIGVACGGTLAAVALLPFALN